MPTYDFRCQDCKEAYTVTVPVKDKDKVSCPKCSSTYVIQSFGGVSIFTGKNCGESKAKARPFS